MKNRQPPRKESDTYIHTDITIGGDAVFKKKVHIQGRADVFGTARIAGEVTLCEKVIAKKDISVDGDTHLKGGLNVEGKTEFQDDVVIKSSIRAKSLIVDEQSILHHHLLAHKDIECKGSITGKEKASFAQLAISEWLTVDGDIVVEKNAHLKQDLVVGNTLRVIKYLDVENIATFQKGVLCNGGMIITGDAQINQGLHVGGNLYSHGDVTFKNSLLVKQDARVNGCAWFDGDASFGALLFGKSAAFEENLKAKLIGCHNFISEDDCVFGKDIKVRGDVVINGDVVARSLSVKEELRSSSLHTDTLVVEKDAIFGRDVSVKENLLAQDLSADKATIGRLKIANGTVESGIYHPKVNPSKMINISYFVTYETQFIKIGDVVHVSGRIDLEANDIDKKASVQLSLPFKSSFKEVGNLSGTGSCNDGRYVVTCFADSIDHQCKIVYEPMTGERSAFFFSFMYRVID